MMKTMSLSWLVILTMAIVYLAAPSPGALPQDERPAFAAESELVVLHVTVKDRQGRYIAGLPRDAFGLLEEGRPQAIPFFTSEDAPVTVGLLIDNSGSMQHNRDLVLAAATAFVERSNSHDEIFALTFNDVVQATLPPDMPFTGDAAVLRAALAHAIAPAGRTALYDAIAAGQEYLAGGRYERKVLVVVSDGGDNVSDVTFEQILNRTRESNIVIHAVGLVDPIEPDADPKRLKQLAQASGGLAFLPHDARQVADALERVALDIRSAYTIGFVPASTAPRGFRHIRVVVHPPDGRSVVVRTRAGYVTGPGNTRDVHAQ
jgi:Ca-activated chloride channel family protein